MGGTREANNLEMLQRLRISAIVNASPDVVQVDYPKQWHVLTVDAEDDEFYPLLETHLEATLETQRVFPMSENVGLKHNGFGKLAVRQ